jgi:hypothetical protein
VAIAFLQFNHIIQMKLFFRLIIFLILINGCKLNSNVIDEQNILGTWHLYDVDQINNETKEDDSFSATSELKKILKDGEKICFFEDESFSNIKGESNYRVGKWKLLNDNKAISFIDNDNGSYTIPIKFEKTSSKKELLTFSNQKNKIVLKFLKVSSPMKDYKDDPFYEINNYWRTKPKQAEDSLELKSRLANYIKHIALILKSAKERKQDVVSFEYSKGPAKIYNGGIGIYPYNIVPKSWKNSFFNEEDALLTYNIYEKYLITSHYRGAAIGNWIEDDFNILLAIYSDIKPEISKEVR